MYEFIIFRGSDIKDLTVFDVDGDKGRLPTADPAIVNAWGPKPQAPAAPAAGWPQAPPPVPPPMGVPEVPSWAGPPSLGPSGFPVPGKGGWVSPPQPTFAPAPAGPQHFNRPEASPHGMFDPPSFSGRGQNDYGGGNRGHFQGGKGGLEDAGKGFGYKGGKGASSEHTGQNFKPADAAAAKKTFTADFDFEQSNKRLDK
eukprot:EG_transcript_24008